MLPYDICRETLSYLDISQSPSSKQDNLDKLKAWNTQGISFFESSAEETEEESKVEESPIPQKTWDFLLDYFSSEPEEESKVEEFSEQDAQEQGYTWNYGDDEETKDNDLYNRRYKKQRLE